MTQTLAIFYDAYRSLSAKKMFWIVLFLSAFAAGLFACVGINERGLTILVWEIEFSQLSTEVIEPAVFYKILFVSFGIGLWLAWFAAILALISTAGIFPDLINSGSIHLVVSKPIGRLRLFLTQYAAGLLFVTLQVALFSLACFLVIGLRGGAWEPGLFVAVPLVVCFFSYLFSVCVLLGLVTRSTLAALLLTLLFWLLTFLVGTAENRLLMARTQQKYGGYRPRPSRVQPRDDRDGSVRRPDNRPAAAPPLGSPMPEGEVSADDDDSALKRGSKVPRAIGRALLKAVAEPSAEDRQQRVKETPPRESPPDPPTSRPDADGEKEGSDKLKLWYDVAYALKTVLPKTTETVGLLERSLYEMADLPEEFMGPPQQAEAVRETAEEIRNRSVWWVVGTSLGFEAVVLCLAAFVFCRRDY